MKNGCDFIKEMSKAKKQKCYQRLRKIMSGRVSKIRRVEGKEKLKIGWSMREYWQERKGKWKIKRKKNEVLGRSVKENNVKEKENLKWRVIRRARKMKERKNEKVIGRSVRIMSKKEKWNDDWLGEKEKWRKEWKERKVN